jgi:hypothetical protein
MNMKDLIDYIDEVRKNDYSQSAKIMWVSDVDAMVKDQIMKTYAVHEIERVEDQANYSLPSGVTFNMVEKVYVDGKEIPKIDYRTFLKTGYYLNDSGEIEFYPVPSNDDPSGEPGIRIVYQEGMDRYTTADYTNNTKLLVPDPYATLYSEYIFSQMNYLDKQIDDYNNDVVKYNNSLNTFATWYNGNRPQNGYKVKNYW